VEVKHGAGIGQTYAEAIAGSAAAVQDVRLEEAPQPDPRTIQLRFAHGLIMAFGISGLS
jgi:hypothetical protein